MRPKKVILLVDDDETALGVRTFLLETRGYRVIAARGGAAALEVLKGSAPDAINLLAAELLMVGKVGGNELVKRAKKLHPMLPALLFSRTVTSYGQALAADAFLPRGACSPVDFLDRVRVLMIRKRGPRKHAVVLPEYRAIGERAAEKAVAA